MSKAHPDAPATHFRLSPESWAEAVGEYRAGATAADVGARWRVSPSSVYRHACGGAWSKKRNGDDVARAHVAEVRAKADAAFDALAGGGSPDPVALAQAALVGSAQALARGDVGEAQGLARLAGLYGRVVGVTGESIDEQICRAAFDRAWTDERFSIADGGETPLKTRYWQPRMDERRRANAAWIETRQMETRIAELEADLAAAHGRVEPVDSKGISGAGQH